jgi:hypothetical protein
VASLNFSQSAFFVPDLYEAIQQWHGLRGIGPFYVMKNIVPHEFYYYGKPGYLDMSIALAQCGAMQIELVQQHSDEPTVYTDMYPKGSRGGFHHVCHLAPKLAHEMEAYARIGVVPGSHGANGPINFAYFDTRKFTGYYTEVIEEETNLMGLFQEIAKVAATWDGKDLIRVVG